MRRRGKGRGKKKEQQQKEKSWSKVEDYRSVSLWIMDVKILHTTVVILVIK